jgi:hypothetical protein
MAAGVCDFIIEQGADWAVQVFWTNEQTNSPIPAAGPMEMDIVSDKTGQRLIRLDDGGNGGIENGGAPYGIIQMSIDDAMTQQFAAGAYHYDLFVYSAGPPLQRIRLLTGRVTVVAEVTDLGSVAAMGGSMNPSVLPPDIQLTVASDGSMIVDPNTPINAGSTLENGIPLRAGLRGTPGVPNSTPATFTTAEGHTGGPVLDTYQDPVLGSTLNTWLAEGAVITVKFTAQNNGLAVSKVEYVPGGAPSPVGAAAGGSDA